eukprot:m51a1_g10340 hypothetical protein (183) ;mRNA; f:135810-137331
MELVLCAPTSSDAAVWPTRTFPVLRAAGAATSASTAVPSSGCGGAASSDAKGAGAVAGAARDAPCDKSSVSPEQGSPRTPEMHAAESRRGADSDSRSGCRLSTEALSHRSPHATESPKGTHSWHASSPQQQLALQALQQLSALVPSPSTRAREGRGAIPVIEADEGDEDLVRLVARCSSRWQ